MRQSHSVRRFRAWYKTQYITPTSRTKLPYFQLCHKFILSSNKAKSRLTTMPSERVIKLSHTVLFTLSLLASIVALAISASLVSHYNSDGYPPVHTGAYRDRIRILLVASVWSTAVTSKSTLILALCPGRQGIDNSPPHCRISSCRPTQTLWCPFPPCPRRYRLYPVHHRFSLAYGLDSTYRLWPVRRQL